MDQSIQDHTPTLSDIPTGVSRAINRTLPTLSKGNKAKRQRTYDPYLSISCPQTPVSAKRPPRMEPVTPTVPIPQEPSLQIPKYSHTTLVPKNSQISIRLSDHSSLPFLVDMSMQELGEFLLFTASPTLLTVTTSAGSIIEMSRTGMVDSSLRNIPCPLEVSSETDCGLEVTPETSSSLPTLQ